MTTNQEPSTSQSPLVSEGLHLSRLVLNLRDNNARRDLRDTYQMHRTIMRGFRQLSSDQRAIARQSHGVLWRLEMHRKDGLPMLIVQSTSEPDWSSIESGDWLCPLAQLPRDIRYPVQSKAWTPSFSTGQRLTFRLRANVTKRVAARNERLGPTMTGKRVAITGIESQITWLLRRGAASGFEIPGQWIDPATGEAIAGVPLADGLWPIADFRVIVTPEAPDETSSAPRYAEKRQRLDERAFALFRSVRFDGQLIVTNPEAFCSALTCGIGPAKAFGCGLLSVAPPNRPWSDSPISQPDRCVMSIFDK